MSEVVAYAEYLKNCKSKYGVELRKIPEEIYNDYIDLLTQYQRTFEAYSVELTYLEEAIDEIENSEDFKLNDKEYNACLEDYEEFRYELREELLDLHEDITAFEKYWLKKGEEKFHNKNIRNLAKQLIDKEVSLEYNLDMICSSFTDIIDSYEEYLEE